MCIESGKRVPSLVLVDVIVLRVLHGVDAVLAGIDAFEVRSSPAVRVHPRGRVVAKGPGYSGTARLDLQKMTTSENPPVHVSGWQYDLKSHIKTDYNEISCRLLYSHLFRHRFTLLSLSH